MPPLPSLYGNEVKKKFKIWWFFSQIFKESTIECSFFSFIFFIVTIFFLKILQVTHPNIILIQEGLTSKFLWQNHFVNSN
jgi:hypothetical protein